MNLSFEKLSMEHKYPVMEIYNYYIEHTFAAFPGNKLPSNFYEKILDDIKDYPAYAVKLDDKVVGFCYLCSYKNYKTLKETAEVGWMLVNSFFVDKMVDEDDIYIIYSIKKEK